MACSSISKKVAPLAEITSERVRTALGAAPAKNDDDLHVVVFYPDLSAASVQTVLRGVADSKWPSISLAIPSFEDKDLRHVCEPTLSSAMTPDPERPQVISIEYQPDRVWVGRSVVNEFQEIPPRGDEPDYHNVEETLKELAIAAGFDGLRKVEQPAPIAPTIEYAADPTISGNDYLRMLETFCCREFCEIAILQPENLTARAKL